jgi:phosphatidylinositol glycan class B
MKPTVQPPSKEGGGKTDHGSGHPVKLHAEVVAAQASDILSLLLVFRFVNALCLGTFFQPDEYFQALEPAWKLAFGVDSGAWMTWVKTRLIDASGKHLG